MGREGKNPSNTHPRGSSGYGPREFYSINRRTGERARRFVQRWAKWLDPDEVAAACDGRAWEMYSDRPAKERRKLFWSIVTNFVREEARRRGIRLQHQTWLAYAIESRRSEGYDPSDCLTRAEDLAALATLRSRMPEPMRTVISQYYLDGSTEAIAAEHDITKENVRQILARGRKWLRDRWQGEPPVWVGSRRAGGRGK